jgi:putative MFS transporter
LQRDDLQRPETTRNTSRPTDIGLLISAGYVGSALGSFAFGWAAERYGRIRVLTWTVVLFSLMSLASAAAWDSSSLQVLRFLTGIGVGGELYVALTYINAFAKAERRGWFVLIFQSIYAVDIVAVSLVSVWVVPHFGWQWMFVIGAVPAVFAFIYRRLLPEPPRWLAARGRLAEADEVLTRIEKEIAPHGNLPAIDTSKLRDLFAGIYLKRTITLCVVMFIAQFVGWGVTLWLPSIYKSVFKLPDQQALFLSVIANSMIIFAAVVCASVIDRVGWRKWLSICLTHAIVGFSLAVCEKNILPGKMDEAVVNLLGMVGVNPSEAWEIAQRPCPELPNE